MVNPARRSRRPALAAALAALAFAPWTGACAAAGSPAPPQEPQPPAEAAAPRQRSAAGGAPAAPSPPAAPPAPSLTGDFLPAEIATIGWDARADSPIVLLREQTTGQVVPIWVGVNEARAIAAALHEVPAPRPLTHDLLAALVGKLGARVVGLTIHDLVGDTYFALIELAPREGAPVLVDSRPSDGMALALRVGAPIRIARKILAESPDFEFLAPEGGEQVARAFGLTVVAASAELRERFALPERPGLVVTRATGEAGERGLRRGDLLLEVGGVEMRQPLDLLDAARRAPMDRPLAVTYWREGARKETTLDPAQREEGAAKGPALAT